MLKVFLPRLSTAIEGLKDTGTGRLVAHRLISGSTRGLAGQIEALAIRKLARSVIAEHGQKLSRYPGSKLDELRATFARQGNNQADAEGAALEDLFGIKASAGQRCWEEVVLDTNGFD